MVFLLFFVTIYIELSDLFLSDSTKGMGFPLGIGIVAIIFVLFCSKSDVTSFTNSALRSSIFPISSMIIVLCPSEIIFCKQGIAMLSNCDKLTVYFPTFGPSTEELSLANGARFASSSSDTISNPKRSPLELLISSV